jgi:hypothetical protein
VKVSPRQPVAELRVRLVPGDRFKAEDPVQQATIGQAAIALGTEDRVAMGPTGPGTSALPGHRNRGHQPIDHPLVILPAATVREVSTGARPARESATPSRTPSSGWHPEHPALHSPLKVHRRKAAFHKADSSPVAHQPVKDLATGNRIKGKA